MTELDELSKIVEKFKEPLRLHEGDTTLILRRVANLKQKLKSIGFSSTILALTSTYCYVRTPENGRRMIGPKHFIVLCWRFGFKISRKELFRVQRLFFKNELYKPLTSLLNYFAAIWYDLSHDLMLPENAEAELISLLSEAPLSGRSPEVLVAAASYLVTRRLNMPFSMAYLASYFGVTEVSLRHALPLFGGR